MGLLARGKSGRGEVKNLEVQRVRDNGGVSWVADPEAMPSHWDERADVLAGRADGERARELQYISRRRSAPKDAGLLAREVLANRVLKHPNREEARPAPSRVRRTEGSPKGKIAISQLYHVGVYDEIHGLVRRISNGLKSAEMELAMRGAVSCEVPWVTSKVFERMSRSQSGGGRVRGILPIQRIACRCSRLGKKSRQSRGWTVNCLGRGRRVGWAGGTTICCSKWCSQGAIAGRHVRVIQLFLGITQACGGLLGRLTSQ